MRRLDLVRSEGLIVFNLIMLGGIVFAQDISMTPISLLKKGGGLKSLKAKPGRSLG